MTTYITSDTHFNHENIIRFCNRPWANRTEMNEGLIANWNATVGPTDEVWVLGDFAYVHPDGINLVGLFRRLNGRKNLIIGNHDDQNSNVLKLPWERQERLHRIRYGKGRRAVMCHYPLETWQGAGKGTIMLHGHCHNNLKRVIPHRWDVGVDVPAWNYRPVALDHLFELAEKQEYTQQERE